MAHTTKQLTALVTGATGPLGQRLAAALAAEGYRIIINYRNNKKIANTISKKGAARAIQADVTKPADVKKLFRAAGPVDILINGVGDFIYAPLAKTSPEKFEAVIASNLFSAYSCMQMVLPEMQKQKFGRIINFGSAGCDAITARPLTAPYYIAKTGLLMATRVLAREYAGTGVTINMVAPGVLPHGVKPKGAPVVGYEEVINGVLYLLSPAAKNLTGTYLEVSRGWRPE